MEFLKFQSIQHAWHAILRSLVLPFWSHIICVITHTPLAKQKLKSGSRDFYKLMCLGFVDTATKNEIWVEVGFFGSPHLWALLRLHIRLYFLSKKCDLVLVVHSDKNIILGVMEDNCVPLQARHDHVSATHAWNPLVVGAKNFWKKIFRRL